MKRSYTNEQIIGFLKQAKAGVPLRLLCGRYGFQASTLQKWQRQFGKLVADKNNIHVPSARNETWSLGYSSDSLSNGHQFKIITIVDNFTEEAIDLFVKFNISDADIARELIQITRFRGFPHAIDYLMGTNSSLNKLSRWCQAHQIALNPIIPGGQKNPAFIEIFDTRLYQDCLCEHWFHSLDYARKIIVDWRINYNEHRICRPTIKATRANIAVFPLSNRTAYPH